MEIAVRESFEQALAQLTPEDRMARMKVAVDMVKHGASYREAARVCQVKNGDVYYYANKKTATTDSQADRIATENLIRAQTSIASRAAEILFERVDEGTMKDADLIKTMKAATDTVATYQTWSKGQQSANQSEGMSAVAKLLQGKKITVEDADPATKAIDITPKTGT